MPCKAKLESPTTNNKKVLKNAQYPSSFAESGSGRLFAILLSPKRAPGVEPSPFSEVNYSEKL